MNQRPEVGTKVVLIHNGMTATVVPTGRRVPMDEVNVMFDITGSVMTQPVSNLAVLGNTLTVPLDRASRPART